MRGEAKQTFDNTVERRITPACAGRSAPSSITATGLKDHPRVCGEKDERRPRTRQAVGSPPRVRGEVNTTMAFLLEFGITPACAGRSSPERTARRPRKDHPRVRGEKRRAHLGHRGRLGSPPRARGEVVLVLVKPPLNRITPACAGRSALALDNHKGDADHPRVRGEKRQALPSRHRQAGSPPRARGEVRLVRP